MRLRKLRQMGMTEITERSRQEALKWADRLKPVFRRSRRRGAGLGGQTTPTAHATALFELFRDAAPRRFFPGVETAEAADLIGLHFPAAGRDVVAIANAICSRRFDLLGYENLSFGESVDWHLDPVAGRRAPFVHWSRIDPLNPAVVGDSKVTWELNRHQWLVPLAQAYWLTDDKRYAREAADLVDHWAQANPDGMGLNWSSSLEVAYRAISWAWAFVLLRDAGVFSANEFAGVLSLVRAHARHIERYLSRYFSPNTHLTGEALGLFYVGVLFPEFPESGRWRSLGRQILITESARQIHPDGVFFEQATCYHRYTVEIYLHFLLLAERNEVAVPGIVRERLEKMLEYLLAVITPDGTMAAIGDADGGWLLPLTRRAPSDCRGVFAVAAVLFGRADFAFAARGAAPELLWMLGVPGWTRFQEIEARPSDKLASSVFPDGGYVVMRSDWARDAHHLIFDVGPIGCPFSGAHGHADLLSVQCAVFGEPYLIDPGTYCYTPEIAWRNYFRSTVAHSTIVVDGQNQAEPRGAFAWHTRPSAQLKAWRSDARIDFADASHEGYARLADPVTHRRRIIFVKPRFWVIVDDLSGLAPHDVDLRFQFSPRPMHVRTDRWMSARGRRGEGLWLAPFSAAPMKARLVEGQLEPIEGWMSPHYGRRQAAPAVVYSARLALPVRIATLIMPVDRLTQTPPSVEATYTSAGQLVGLVLTDTGDIVHINDDTIEIESIAASVDPLLTEALTK